MASSFPPFPSFSQQPNPGQRLQQLSQQATALQQAGRWAEAIPPLEELARAQPNNVAILRALATCLTSIERLPAARERIAQALAIEPRNARLYSILAYTWKREASWDNAIDAIDRAIALDPAQPGFVATKAEILHFAGRLQEAVSTIEKVLDKAAAVPAIAGTFATIALRVKRQADAIPPLKSILAQKDLPLTTRIKFSFDLATLYDSIGDTASAWPLFEQGNRLKNERWDPALHSQAVDGIIRSWTRSALAALPRSSVDGSPFVFIVGMPRSGTSLIEQIISTAPQVYAAGERNELLRVARMTSNSIAQGIPMATSPLPLATDPAVKRFAEMYAASVRALAPSARIITDKMPPNFLNLGLIQALLPGAKVIHCRRQAMDSCLSCYFQLFGGALSFAYNLEHCGRFYVDYERLMAHWRATLDLPILDVPYESVVDDQEGWTRNVLDFLGLDFTPDALRFYESNRTTLTASNQQVREPMYRRSLARWRAYSDHLDPLRKALGPYAES